MEQEMKEFRDFESAREFVKSLGLKNQKEWQAYCKSGNKPDDIPSAPKNTYKKDWKGIGDWLGNGRTRNFRPFKEARDFVRALNLKGVKEWRAYYKSGNKPNDIPTAPEETYKNEFKGIGDWLGTGSIATKHKVFRPFKEAREFVRTLNLKGHKDWHDYCISGNKPDDIPYSPWKTYNEWKKK